MTDMRSLINILVIALCILHLPKEASASIDSVSAEAEQERIATEILNSLKEAKGILPTEPPFLPLQPSPG